jgi:V/A-type H+-transporting ATPase subunit E
VCVAAEFKKREESLARIEAKRLVMQKKREILEDILQAIRQKFFEMEGKERKELLEKLAKSVSGECKRVYVSKQDAELAKKLFKNLEIKQANIAGGFILEDESGEVRLDLSFETLFENSRKALVKEISRKLFGDENES